MEQGHGHQEGATVDRIAQLLETHSSIHKNLEAAELHRRIVERNEGKETSLGAINVPTGRYTGRIPEYTFFVDSSPEVAENVNGQVMAEEDFEALHNKMLEELGKRPDLFVVERSAGIGEHAVRVRVIAETAYQAMFSRIMFREPLPEGQKAMKEITVLAAPSVTHEYSKQKYPNPKIKEGESPFIVRNLDKGVVLVGGTQYCGEIKKSIFSMMNSYLPEEDVLPMHCSANIGPDGNTAVFFGLSGTGKTTLSADPSRTLIGDDEHYWSPKGVANMEGGCYAKCIKLKPENEPIVYGAIKPGALLENVVTDEAGNPNWDDGSLAENTRVAYPLDHVPGVKESGEGPPPKHIIFLTCDAYGVLPPIARLNTEQAMYHFLSGYTAKVAGTEAGVKEPTATFSACFGEPFMSRNPIVYAKLLKKYIEEFGTEVYVVNTGWSGSMAEGAQRFRIPDTRAIVSAVLGGKLSNAEYRKDPVFNFDVPMSVEGVDAAILNPENAWKDKLGYHRTKRKLADEFGKNFRRFVGEGRPTPEMQKLINAGPLSQEPWMGEGDEQPEQPEELLQAA